MKSNHLSVTVSDEVIDLIQSEVTLTGCTKSKAVNNLILNGATQQTLVRLVEKSINQNFAELKQELVGEISKDLDNATEPMLKAAKSMNSMRKSSSQTRQAALANFVLLSILAPQIFELETLSDGQDLTSSNFVSDNITSSEIFDWFWSLGGMLADGRRGGINSTAAKSVAATTGRSTLGGNRPSAYMLFSQAAMSELEPPADDEELYTEFDYEEGYENDFN